MCEAVPWEGETMARAKADCKEHSRRWTEWVSKWQGSGSSQAAFCREHGLNGNTFNYWKLRVLKQRPGTKRFRRVPGAKSAANGGKARFTPVRVVAAAPGIVAPACAYEVSLRSGHTIRIASNFDEASLRRLIGVLDGASSAC